MDPEITHALKTALTLWTAHAVAYLKGHKEQMAELRKGMQDAGADVRIVYHVRGAAITIETIDLERGTIAELFREVLVPDDGGFALPVSEMKQ
jgi:hypothetical protein